MNPLVRPFELQIRAQGTGLRVVRLAVGGRVRFPTGTDEVLVLPLTGGCDVACDDERMTLTGRRSVFSRVTDFAYLPRGTTVTLRAPNGGRFALPAARAGRDLPFRYGAAEDVPVEVSGYQVNNLCTPGSFETGRLIAREILIPEGTTAGGTTVGGTATGGTATGGTAAGETAAGQTATGGTTGEGMAEDGDGRAGEEVRYFEVAGGNGCGYQWVSGRRIEVRTGDVMLIPPGGPGPSSAVPGHDLYHLTVSMSETR
ncbi:MAG TPA: 5-deoxy-glucuronate isomerase [Actinoplanes sp.]|nr:5-deoxy-glucuronate isomerase [Actinoplanes sp.]